MSRFEKRLKTLSVLVSDRGETTLKLTTRIASMADDRAPAFGELVRELDDCPPCFAQLHHAGDVAGLAQMPIADLRELARTANFSREWLEVDGENGRAELLALLTEELREHQIFVNQCDGDARDALVRADGWDERFCDEPLALADGAMASIAGASVHLVPSGCGVFIEHHGTLAILTCAHCVTPDGNMALDTPDEDRLGLYRSVVAIDGTTFLSRCVAVDGASDLALLELYRAHDAPQDEIPQGDAPRPCVALVSDVECEERANVVCVGRGDDVDGTLEGACFTVSSGTCQHPCLETGREGFDRFHHSAWTQDGHSGAPLFGVDTGAPLVVGIHSGYDDDVNQRHGVDLERINAFLDFGEVAVPVAEQVEAPAVEAVGGGAQAEDGGSLTSASDSD
jgi:hypothetical protein